MEEKVADLLLTERCRSKNRRLHSDGALLALLLLFVLGCIYLGNLLETRFDISAIWVQLGLFLLLLGICCFVYRTRLLGFRYTLTKGALYVDRLVGNREKGELVVALSQIETILDEGEAPPKGVRENGRSYLGRRRDALALLCRFPGTNGEKSARIVRVSVSGEMKERIRQTWTACQNA